MRFSLPRGVRLEAYAVHCDHRQAVGHGVSALHGLPGVSLPLLFVGRVAKGVAYGCGVNEQLCAS